MNAGEIKYHSCLLDLIDTFKKNHETELISEKTSLNKIGATLKPFNSAFKLEFTYLKGREDLSLGQNYKNIEIQILNSHYILENVFLGNRATTTFTGTIENIHTKGFSQTHQYYFQVVIPLETELRFHFNIEETFFTTDLGYSSRLSTNAIIQNETIQICCIDRGKNDFFLVIDSTSKQSYEEFVNKVHSIQIGLGYLSGYYAADQAYFFAYELKEKKLPQHFRIIQLRESIKSSYKPIYSNPYSYLYNNQLLAKKYEGLLRTVSIKEFSILCEKLYTSVTFASVVMLILESSVASLLFMPGGYAIALETMSDLIIGDKKTKLAPIKDKSLSRKIREELLAVLHNNKSLILEDDLLVLQKRISQINQTTNMARLKAPFDLLNIKLEEEDLKVLETRNDFFTW